LESVIWYGDADTVPDVDWMPFKTMELDVAYAVFDKDDNGFTVVWAAGISKIVRMASIPNIGYDFFIVCFIVKTQLISTYAHIFPCDYYRSLLDSNVTMKQYCN
jgi:hypothetical protein